MVDVIAEASRVRLTELVSFWYILRSSVDVDCDGFFKPVAIEKTEARHDLYYPGVLRQGNGLTWRRSERGFWRIHTAPEVLVALRQL
ncbi:MAG: hypothetical protein M9928_15470 [Anaerolineae bacterium]|nr:hypothetical protein [Anaerolineae bacterium]MCO5194588.1 hypothetical protein [Anaerolineae bacterium]MCO5199213.1 hypothetical protein [Anaerolineae bacterium]MCO5206435.1 hypothetical protein [Anaerolineae bacterium]